MLHQVAAQSQTLHGRPAQAQRRAAVTCSAWTGVRPARLSPAVPRRCGPAAAQLLAARRAGVAVSALGKPDAEEQPKLTRKQEPDEYWRSADEASGKSPLQDPMAVSALLGLIVPFTILAIGIGSGYIEMH